MGRFQELGANKNTILLKLTENDDIVKCLVNNQADFLTPDLPNDFDRSSLIYSHIYPYSFIPPAQTEAKTLITMAFSYKPYGTTFKIGSIYFYVITHNSLVRTDEGTLRYDFLANKIDEVFNSTRAIGLSKMAFYNMGDITVNENYSGVFIAYQTTEFQ